METVTELDRIISLFENNGWNVEIEDGRIYAETFGDLPLMQSSMIDVTGWSFEKIDDYFGFNEHPAKESTWDINRN